MRRSFLAAVATAALFAGACTDGAPVPTAPPAIPGPSFSHLTPTAFQIRDQIKALFRKDLMQPLSSLNQQDYALSQFSKVEQKMKAYNAATSEAERKLRLKEARFSAFALIVNAFIRFHKGDLVGGKTEDTKLKMIALDASVLRFVDFEEVPDLTTFAAAPSEDRVVTLVTAAPFTALPESKAFGMKGGQNCLPLGITGLLVGSKIKTPEKVGDGPLPGGYRQFPTMVEWSLTRSDGKSGFDCPEGVLLGAVEVDKDGPDAKYHPVHSSLDSDGTTYFLPAAYTNDPTQRLRLAQLLHGSVVVHEPADASALGLEPSGATAFAPERPRSGMLAMARWGLKTALWQIGQFLSPKPAYAFTLLLGCRTRIPTGSSSQWAIIDRYPPVAEVSLTSSSPTVNLGESVNLTVTQEDAYGVTLEDNTATPPHPVGWTATSEDGGEVEFTATSNMSATVRGKTPGTVTISATSEGITGTVTVTVPAPCSLIGGAPSAGVIFQGTFTGDAVGSPPCAPDIGTWSLTRYRPPGSTTDAGTILVRQSLTGLSDKPVEFHQTSSSGDVGLRLMGIVAGTPPSTGTYSVKWKSAVLTAPTPTTNAPAAVNVHGQNGQLLAFLVYQENGGLLFGSGSGWGNLTTGWSIGVAQDFEMLVNLSTGTARLSINGVPMSQTASFPAGYSLARILMDVHTEVKIGWDDIRITSTAPVIDGTFSAGEWGAPFRSFDVNLPGGGTTSGELFIRNDATNLYLAIRFRRGFVDAGNTAAIEFDNNNSGGLDNGDDGIILNPSIGFLDLVRSNTRPSGETCLGCSFVDTDFGGTNDGAGAFANDGTFTVYEFSHPLNSGDARDFARSAGQPLGLFLFIRMTQPPGNFPADFGDTAYPGFGQFLQYTISP